MNFTQKIRFAGALSFLGVLGFTAQTTARENISASGHKAQLKTTVTGCQPAVAAIDLDINNVRARLMTGGDMWWNIGLEVAAYEVPRSSGRSSQFAASCWIGGYDKQGQLKVAAQTYRQDGNDYWPGALDVNAKISIDDCANWDRFWKVDKSTINRFIEAYKTGGSLTTSEFETIVGWPAKGNNLYTKGANGTPLNLGSVNEYAPFEDLNKNGLYEPLQGEYPKISGDQFIWWVCNDAGNVKQQTQTSSMGIEVQTSAFAYSTQDFLNNATFYNYRVINRGALTIDSTYIAVWDDCDLGYYHDDFIGCDTTRGLGIMYNGSSNDGQDGGYPVNSYGANPPQIGVDFFQGPLKTIKRPGQSDTVQRLGMTNFTYYNNDASTIGNPTNGIQIYNYMTGSIRNGDRFSNDFQGPGVTSKGYGSGPVSNFVFTGDPGDKTTWSECTCDNQRGDRRFIFSSGPFQLLPGKVNDITFGCVWASGVGGCPNTDFKTIKSIDDGAQALFDAGFKTVEGPEAPRLVVRELDRRLVFYIMNDYGSNNYAENYGRATGTYKDSLRYHQTVSGAKGISTDTLYHFEGYRVFQLANSQVTTAEIFDPSTGEVDNTKAYEVFECDIANKVTKIVNYTKVTSVSDSTWMPQIKVNGKDSGILHSFQITQDQFSPVADKALINYHNYYFVAIAYAYNNYAMFDPLHYIRTQDKPYLGSSHGAGGINIPVAVGMPNPANGAMGTTLNADFGSGIVVSRIEGVGNGGNVTDLDDATESAIVHDYSAGKLTYKEGLGPVNISVVDPVKVPAFDWIFQVKGKMSDGVISDSTYWVLTAKTDLGNMTIYSERDLSSLNEQIIEKYGLSVNVRQVKAPGAEQDKGNGYITSTVKFDDQTQPWLWGVTDQADSNFANWIRSGNNTARYKTLDPCDFNDNSLDTFQAFENMMSNFSPTQSTWAPYMLAASFQGRHTGNGSPCGFQVAWSATTQTATYMGKLPDVDLVFTSDKSLWTKCAVIEQQEDTNLAEGKAQKFFLRNHPGWTGEVDGNGNDIYSENAADRGTSYFPGYAVDVNTGLRLNIVFGEDSYLGSDNGDDMLWNPTSRIFNAFDNSIIYGGKHVVYVLNTKYDQGAQFVTGVRGASLSTLRNFYAPAMWVGIPTLNPATRLKSVAQGIIPTTTTLRFRVNRPYAPYAATSDTSSLYNTIPGQATYPYYTFSTAGLAPTALSDHSDKKGLLDRIKSVPNPYYGYSGYESSRYDTKIRIINLPARTTIYVYSLDGTLVRTLTKSDPNTSYIDWDVRNNAGLPISSGMYLMDVKAEGIGETVIKWFGAMRPIDATTY